MSKWRILGQVATAATTDTTIYTVPSNVETHVERIYCTNRDAGAGTVRIAIVKGGESVGNKNYIAYDITVNGNSAMIYELASMIAGDFIVVRASTANFSFSVFGEENALS